MRTIFLLFSSLSLLSVFSSHPTKGKRALNHCIRITPQKERELNTIVEKLTKYIHILHNEHEEFDITLIKLDVEKHSDEEEQEEKNTLLQLTVNDCAVDNKVDNNNVTDDKNNKKSVETLEKTNREHESIENDESDSERIVRKRKERRTEEDIITEDDSEESTIETISERKRRHLKTKYREEDNENDQEYDEESKSKTDKRVKKNRNRRYDQELLISDEVPEDRENKSENNLEKTEENIISKNSISKVRKYNKRYDNKLLESENLKREEDEKSYQESVKEKSRSGRKKINRKKNIQEPDIKNTKHEKRNAQNVFISDKFENESENKKEIDEDRVQSDDSTDINKREKVNKTPERHLKETGNQNSNPDIQKVAREELNKVDDRQLKESKKLKVKRHQLKRQLKENTSENKNEKIDLEVKEDRRETRGKVFENKKDETVAVNKRNIKPHKGIENTESYHKPKHQEDNINNSEAKNDIIVSKSGTEDETNNESNGEPGSGIIIRRTEEILAVPPVVMELELQDNGNELLTELRRRRRKVTPLLVFVQEWRGRREFVFL